MKLKGLLLVVASLFGSFAPAQQAEMHAKSGADRTQAEAPRFHQAAVVEIVSFEVAVSDEHGPVLGLTPADFRVLHDGKPVELSNFAFYRRTDDRRAPARTEASTKADVAVVGDLVAEERPGLSLYFYVDNDNLSPFNRGRVLEGALEFVRTRLGPRDRAAVVFNEGGPKTAQGLTENREEVVSALQRLRDKPGGRSIANAERLQAIVDVQRTAQEVRALANSTRMRPSLEQKIEAMAQSALNEVRSFEQTERLATRNATRGMRAMVTAMSGLPGRKALVYVSDGLPNTPGQAAYRAFEQSFRDVPFVRNQLNDVRMYRTAEGSEQGVFDEVVTSAAAAGVAVFTIDARGLVAPGHAESMGDPSASWSEEVRNYQEPLQRIAVETGGSAFVNGNDFRAGLDQFARELDSYYLLGYPLPGPRRKPLHTVEVELVNRRGCRLSYRQRFVERSLPALVEDRVLAALSFDPNENPLGISATSGTPRKGTSKTWDLPVRIGVPIGKLALLPEGDQMVGQVTAYYVTRDGDNRQSALHKADHRVAVPRGEYESARRRSWPITATLVVRPGSYRIAVGVREELTGVAGYATLVLPEGAFSSDADRRGR